MSYLDLNNDAKSIVAKRLSNDMNITKMFMSKHYDFQKILFGEIVFDEDIRIYMYIYVYVCMYVCIYVYRYICIYIC